MNSRRDFEKIEEQKKVRELIPTGWYYFELSSSYELDFFLASKREPELQLAFSLENMRWDNGVGQVDGKSVLSIEEGTNSPWSKLGDVDLIPAGLELPTYALGDGMIDYGNYCSGDGKLKESRSLQCVIDLGLRFSEILNIHRIVSQRVDTEPYEVSLFLSDRGLTDWERTDALDNHLPVKITMLRITKRRQWH